MSKHLRKRKAKKNLKNIRKGKSWTLDIDAETKKLFDHAFRDLIVFGRSEIIKKSDGN